MCICVCFVLQDAAFDTTIHVHRTLLRELEIFLGLPHDSLDSQYSNQSFYHSRALNNVDALLAMERIWNYTYAELCQRRKEFNLTEADVCSVATSYVKPGGSRNVFKQLFKKNLRDGVFCGFSVSGVLYVYCLEYCIRAATNVDFVHTHLLMHSYTRMVPYMYISNLLHSANYCICNIIGRLSKYQLDLSKGGLPTFWPDALVRLL